MMKNEAEVLVHHWRDAVPDDRISHLIRDVSRALSRSLAMRLERHGVSVGYWTFLRVLWESDGITQKELSVRAGVMEPTTFTAVKAMEALGYIVRTQLPPNRKNVYVYLTPKGRALKQKLVPLAIETNEVAARTVPSEVLHQTRDALLTMLENLAADEVSASAAAEKRPRARAVAGKAVKVGRKDQAVKAAKRVKSDTGVKSVSRVKAVKAPKAGARRPAMRPATGAVRGST